MRGGEGPPGSKVGAALLFCPTPCLEPRWSCCCLYLFHVQKLTEALLHLLHMGNSHRWAALPPTIQGPRAAGHCSGWRVGWDADLARQVVTGITPLLRAMLLALQWGFSSFSRHRDDKWTMMPAAEGAPFPVLGASGAPKSSYKAL